MMAMILSVFIVRMQAQVTAFSEDFESGVPSSWIILDADNDGATWTHSFVSDPCYGGHNNSDGYMFSYDASNVDNWMITPQITLGTEATLTFWRCAMYTMYAEHFGVYVSTTTTDLSAFTLVYEETGVQGQNGWRQRIVDISAYDGNSVYIAFRHFNSNAQILGLDDITVTMNTANSTIFASPNILNFGTVPAGSPTPVQLVNVSAFNVTGGVTASVNSPFEVSTNDTVYTNSALLPDSGGILYVRYNPIFASVDSTVLTLTGGNATQTVTLSGASLDCSYGISLPYMQDFDDTPLNTMPDCWYQINPYEGFPKVTNTNSHSGKALTIISHDNTGDPDFAVMPQMPQELSDLQVSFWAACQGIYSGTLTVGYVTDPSDSSTFVPVWSKSYSEIGNTNFHPFIVSFADVNTITPNNHIAFKHQSATGWGWVLDDVVVDVISSCSAPTELTVNEVGGTTANISWTGNVDNYEVYYRPTNDTTWNVIQNVTLDSTGFTLTNLLPTTSYTWYVASDCGDGTFANSLQPSTFTTQCSFFQTPFSEDFNAQNAIPNCWLRMSGSVSNAFAGINPSVGNSGWSMSTVPFGNYHPKVNIWGVATSNWLVTPEIDLSSLTNPALSFDLALTRYSSADPILNPAAQADDKFMVIVSTDNGATWSASNATIWSDSASVGDYPYSLIRATGQGVTISLAAYANQTVRIAFYGESTASGGDNDLHIDNVLVHEAPSCAKPSGVSVDSISHNSAVISWNGNAGVSTWLIEYKAEGETIWVTQTITDTTVVLNGLAATTAYTVRVYADCSEEEYSLPTLVNFTTTMAVQGIPYSTDFAETSDRNWILNNGNRPNYWTFGSIGDESALFITNNGTTAGYAVNGSFSIVSAEKLFAVGNASDVVISFDARIGGEGTFDYLKVFFAPADENYPASNTNVNYANYDYGNYALSFPTGISSYPYMMNLTNGNTVHVELTAPNPNTNPTENSTAKLVFLWKNDQSDGTQPGAVIYNVSLDAVACSAPADLTVENITTNSADISWTPTGSTYTWALEYKEEGESTWTYVMVNNTPSFSLVGLLPGSTYQLRVKSICDADEESLWTTTSFFTYCNTVTNFPFTEDFEHNGNMPDCWQQEYVTGTIDWTYENGSHNSGTNAHGGNYNALFYNASSNGFTTKLISPIFDLTNVGAPALTYWYSQAAWGNDQDFLTVYYRTSPSAQWQVLNMHTTSVPSWTKDSLMLPNPTATYQIAFEGIARYGHGITLDDITVCATSDAPVITNPTVATMTATNVDQTTATLNATINNPDNVTITAKGFEWKTTGGAYTQIAGGGTGNTFTADLTGLTPNTSYTYKAFITYNGTTVYGSEVAFMTLDDVDDPCEAPTDLQQIIMLKELGGIYVTWSDNAGVSEWNLQYRPLNGEWITVVVTGQPEYEISGLVDGEDYEIRVQAVCGPDNLSEWSAILTATASNSGVEDFLTNSVTLYPNPANDVINVQCTMNDVQVKAIEVFDVYGKVVRTEETLRATSLQTVQINVSDFAAGMYFVRVTTEDGVVTKSFVKK